MIASAYRRVLQLVSRALLLNNAPGESERETERVTDRQKLLTHYKEAIYAS